MSNHQEYSPGVRKYIEESKKYLAKRQALLERVKNYKFNTLAVHGLYSVEEALEQNQGALIEPLYLSASQAYRDSDEMEAALAYLIPTWCYTRIANPSTYYLEWTMALLEGYKTGVDTSCVITASGMGAIMSAVDPFLVKQKEGPASSPVNAMFALNDLRTLRSRMNLFSQNCQTVATIPAISTHQQQGEEGREMADVPPQLIRLCVGGEDPADVIADLEQALNSL